VSISEQGSGCVVKLANNDIVSCSNPCDALLTLANSIIPQDVIVKQDISWLVPFIMLVFEGDLALDLRKNISYLLMNFAADKELGDIIREFGGITALMKLSSDSDEEVLDNVLKALAYLMCNETNR
jgi:ABC-type phosphate/phosphonate transport system substrate-binding protein